VGGGGGGSSTGNLDELLRRAREEAARAKHAKRNVFLSFAVEDVAEVNLLRGQARNEKSDIEFNDWSVREPYDSARADYIRLKIRERIAQSSTTVVYVSENTPQSKWVNWEIEESIRLGKRVIAVYRGDTAPKQVPSALGKSAIKPIPWSRLSDELNRG
jgi:hypothetical protein